MKKLIPFLILFLAGFAAQSQFVYKIKADSVLITNDSCTAELNLENSTKNVNGFLFNKGRGRTEFRKGLIKFGDSLFTLGVDTVNLNTTGSWRLTGNTGTIPGTNFLGTSDGADLNISTNNTTRMTFHGTETKIGINKTAPTEMLHLYGNNPRIYLEGDSASFAPSVFFKSAGNRLGYLSPYGVESSYAGGLHLATSTAFGYSQVGATIAGVKTTSTDSTVITHQVVGAPHQTADIFDISENLWPTPGNVVPNSFLKVKSTGILTLSKYKNSVGEDSVLSTDVNGNVKLRSMTSSISSNAWGLTGNTGTNPSTNFIGTTDSTKLIFKTFNRQRASILANGIINIGLDDASARPAFRFYPNGDFTSNTKNNYNDSSTLYKNGIRYHGRLGYLEIGTSNFIDTTISEAIDMYQTSALILNTDSPNHLEGKIQSSFVAAYNFNLAANKTIRYSLLSGGSFFSSGNLKHVIAGGVYHTIPGDISSSLVMGNSQQITASDNSSGWFGFYNKNEAVTYGNVTGGIVNSMGSVSQLTVGSYLVNRAYSATALGNGNVNFTSQPYNSYDSILVYNTHTIQPNYLLFSLGNSQSKAAVTRSNALSILYNGRTQINTTGFNNALSESDATPKAALEVVSTTSGILLPKLTNTQRGSIAGGDLHNGLLLYNTDDSKFQFYDGSNWKSISDDNTTTSSFWGLTGNASTNPSTNFLGTTDSKRLVFRTKNIERATIDTTGNFMIGTSTDNGSRLNVLRDGTSLTTEGRVINASTQGATFNTTSSVLSSYGGYFNSNATRASGSNALTNIGLFTTASGGQTNIALKTDGAVNMTNLPTSTDTTSYKPLAVNSSGDVVKVTGWPPVVNYSVQSLSESSGTFTWNVANGINGQISLSGTGKTLAITNPVAGMTYTVRITQGSANSTITTWPTGSKWPSGTTPTLSTVSGRVDIVVFYYDGTNYYGTYQQHFQ